TAFAIGAAKAARSLGAKAATGLAAAKSKLKASTSGPSAVTARGNRALAQAQVRLAGLITTRLDQRLAHAPPRLQIMVRVLAGDRRILHVVRPSADDAVALARILSGALPTHHGFLTDDAVDQVGAAPHRLYTEADEPRDDSSLEALLKARPAVLPMRGMIPFLLPRPRRSAVAARLQLRGPVLELELEDESGCRGVLTRDEAELAAGYFLKLQLDGRLSVSLATGPS
ncbi:MAG: hypothetical protein K1X89_18870, partial [Myxococcaceae bacterium]|nr:hypothetical protein [Myxococcaceae bacterium]